MNIGFLSKKINIKIADLEDVAIILDSHIIRNIVIENSKKNKEMTSQDYVTQWIYQNLIRYYQRNIFHENALDKLIIQKYDKYEIAAALAKAWIKKSDTFELEKNSLFDRIGKSLVVLFISIMSTLLVCIILINHFKKEYPEVVSSLLMLNPILAFTCILFTWVIYLILKKVS